MRGSFSDPQINGRMKFENAAFNIVDVPNGISNATGTVIFTKDRATIQSLTGETGGGKIDLSGFASYGGGQTGLPPARPRHRSARALSRGRQHGGQRQSEPHRDLGQQHALRHA